MEILLLSFAIMIAVLALVLYLELKSTQERLENVRRDIEKRVNEKIQTVIHDTTEKLPEIEKRVAEIAEQIAHQQHDQALRDANMAATQETAAAIEPTAVSPASTQSTQAAST